MAAACPSILKFCVVRVTRLDPITGGVINAANNSYVTNGAISLQLTPELEEGTESTLKNGCGAIVASSKTPDRFKRWNFVLTMAQFEPGLIEILTGNDIITVGGDPVGIEGDDQFAANFQETLAAFEGWAQAYEGDAPDPARPYFYVLFPATTWTIGDTTLQEEFATLPLNGFSRNNTAWATGPYDDTGLTDSYSTWVMANIANAPPAAQCGYKTIAATS